MVGQNQKQLFMETSSLCPVSINHLVSSKIRNEFPSVPPAEFTMDTQPPRLGGRRVTLPESWDVITAKGETWAFHVPSGNLTWPWYRWPIEIDGLPWFTY
jgi:hypothetical protein